MSPKGPRACGPIETAESLPPFLLSEPIWLFVAWQGNNNRAPVWSTKPFMSHNCRVTSLHNVLLEILGNVSLTVLAKSSLTKLILWVLTVPALGCLYCGGMEQPTVQPLLSAFQSERPHLERFFWDSPSSLASVCPVLCFQGE